jgi:histidine triad (HIT) family protein
MDCLFCRIVAGEIPATKVYEDEACLSFRDINPQAPTHVLVIPRKHIASIKEMTAEDETLLGHLLRVCGQVAQQENLGDGGFRTVINTGPDAGQTVFHVHAHVLGGRPMAWPPG